MAEKTGGEFNCFICHKTYTDPRILQCFHIYCQKCLLERVVQDHQQGKSFSCPICHQITLIPASGIAGLKPAFHINRLLHKNESVSMEKADSMLENKSSCEKLTVCCSEHNGREVEVFCETCEMLICYKCVSKCGKHHNHDYEDINDSIKQYKEELTPLLQLVDENMQHVTEVSKKFDLHYEEITEQQKSIEAEIRNSSKQLHEVINRRQDELISQLYQITKIKQQCYTSQNDQIMQHQARLGRCLEFTRESLKTDIHEALTMKTAILKQVRELASKLQLDLIIPCTGVTTTFSALEDAATAACQNYGKIYASELPDPSKCVATGSGIEDVVVGEKTATHLSIVNSKGEPCGDTIVSLSLEVELASELTGSKVNGSIEHGLGGHGKHIFNYQPTVKGRHQLQIKVNGQHIVGSPFIVAVKLPVKKLGTPFQTLNNIGSPWGVAINGKGEVVVTEFVANCVSVFKPCGEKIEPSFGNCHSSSRGCTGVTVDGEENIVVTDWVSHHIRKFTPDGVCLKDVGEKGCESLQFHNPCSIAYSASNKRFYVADTYNHRVQVLNSDLEFVSKFGTRGQSIKQFEAPYGIATDSTGRVYVADSGNHRIQVFTADGKCLRMLSKHISNPVGVAVDGYGLLYVSDGGSHKVSVFTSDGELITSFGEDGRESGQFKNLRGIAVDDIGLVYVCDGGNNRVQIF